MSEVARESLKISPYNTHSTQLYSSKITEDLETKVT